MEWENMIGINLNKAWNGKIGWASTVKQDGHQQ